MKRINENQISTFDDCRNCSPIAPMIFHFKFLNLCILIDLKRFKLFLMEPLALQKARHQRENIFTRFERKFIDLPLKGLQLNDLH